MAETIRLTIDGKAVEVDKGTSVIEAARKAGVMPPHYCYHPGLTVAGNCRMCLVEIEKMPKLVTSCTTQAADGMVVLTRSDKVKKGVAGVEEFLLANHPLDCPICDQAGECRLQEYSFKYGNAGSRFREHRMNFKKDVEVGPHVVLDSERCIMCTRCVRFCDEVTRSSELGVFQRGLHNEIGIFPGRPLANDYSGNVVDICPVGALTLKEFRFQKRVWFIRDVPTVCGGCAAGCNVNLGTSENRIYRLTPRENQAVNGWWMCDEGRLSYKPIAESKRLADPESKGGAGFEPSRLPDAAAKIADRLKAAGPSGAAILASANLTVEDLWVVKRLAGAIGPALRVVVPERLRGKDDGFLIKADRTANRKGAALLGFDVDAGGGSTRALLDDVASGRITTLLAIAEDPAALPGGDRALAVLAKGGQLLTIDPFLTVSAGAAAVRVPAAAYGEFEGTYVNFHGRAQRVRRAVTPRSSALPVWQLVALVLQRLGATAAYGSAPDILREVAGAVPAFAGVTWTSLGAGGRALEEPGAGASIAPKGIPRGAGAARG
ncbi:MAG: (2Fe-2S)-binding protein [Acidobacteria bacterium]|nr:(2Fe-2S)-binding protein [Acidobacteriota bacterium]